MEKHSQSTMSQYPLRRKIWYPLSSDDSDDGLDYATENVFRWMDEPFETFALNHTDVPDLQQRVEASTLFADLTVINSDSLWNTYRNIKRTTVLLRRQLRRVTRHLDILEDHVSFRKAQLKITPKRLKTNNDAVADGPGTASGTGGAGTGEREHDECDGGSEGEMCDQH